MQLENTQKIYYLGCETVSKWFILLVAGITIQNKEEIEIQNTMPSNISNFHLFISK